MSEDKKPFTVTDRRHFTREGEVRAGDVRPEPAAAQPAKAPPAVEEPRRAPEPPAPPAPTEPSAASVDAAYRASSALGGGGLEGPGETLDFVGLLLSLGTQASMMLGLSGPPGHPPGPPDLGGARSIIGLLEILRDKTEGRRSQEEEEVLQGLLYELRMQYVAMARKGGP